MRVEPNLAEWLENYPNWNQNGFFQIGKQKCSPTIVLKLAIPFHAFS
jgi:hypothetical protein